MDPRTPVIVGAGQIVNRDGAPLAPLELMAEAARRAAADAGAPALLERAQSMAVVDAMSAPLGDPGAQLADLVGASPQETVRTGLGGNGPQALLNDLAARVVTDGLDVALIAGAEAMATVMRLMKSGEAPPWAQDDGDARADRVLATDAASEGASAAENAAGLIAPIFHYPLIEHALRADAGRDREQQLAHISELWAGFSEVAASNEHAWSRDTHTAAELAVPAPANRRVSDPYLKLHNSHIGVDMGAALILCSAAAAQAAGVSRDRWVFPWAGAGAHEHWHVTTRERLHRCPGLRLAGEALFDYTGLTADDLGPVDLYSCFPSAVQIGARELGLALDRPLTVTGGLSFAGGPGNNYVTHGIATLVARLRERPEAVGLATGVGWYVTKHALGVYSGRAPRRAYRALEVQDEVDALPKVEVVEGHAGDATVESFTALYEKDGRPGMGIVVGRLADGRRAVAKSHAPDVLAELVDGEDPLGRPVTMTAPEGFAFRP